MLEKEEDVNYEEHSGDSDYGKEQIKEQVDETQKQKDKEEAFLKRNDFEVVHMYKRNNAEDQGYIDELT